MRDRGKRARCSAHHHQRLALIAADVADCFTNRSVGLFGVALLVGAHYVLTDRKLSRMERRERSAFHLGRESVRSLR